MLQVPTAVLSDSVSLRLGSTLLLKEQVAEYTSCFALAGSLLLNYNVLAVADGLFGLYGSDCRGGLFVRYPTVSPPPPRPRISCMWLLWTLSITEVSESHAT